MRFRVIILWFLMVISAIGCTGHGGDTHREHCNGVYWWKTVFDPDSAETAFLKEFEVGRMYVKFFDVDVEMSPTSEYYGEAVPVGTLEFKAAKPGGIEIVPTVFITTRAVESAMRQDDGILECAENIAERILRMVEYNDFGPVAEVQLDCDWTPSTRAGYFEICQRVGDILNPQGIRMSSTIRLHQLRMSPPPVDRGVLMVYNTGSIKIPSTRNSILDPKDVAPFLSKSVEYGIPLDIAYPAYGWGIWFRGDRFMSILHRRDYSDTTLYSPLSDGKVTVLAEHILENHTLKSGDVIRIEDSPAATVLSVKQMIEKAFPEAPHSNIIYHLDSDNLSKYSSHEIKSIFEH